MKKLITIEGFMKTKVLFLLFFISFSYQELNSKEDLFFVDMPSAVLTTGAIVCLLGKYKMLDVLDHIGQWGTGKGKAFYFSLNQRYLIDELQNYCGYFSGLLVFLALGYQILPLNWQKG